jgi:chorismate synthase
MAKRSLKNIPLNLFRDFLISRGLKHIRTNGGHEVWGGISTSRPVVLQTHVNPIPEFIIKNNLRTIGATPEDFINWLIEN